jgi:small-conductance mechanosensitive channel
MALDLLALQKEIISMSPRVVISFAILLVGYIMGKFPGKLIRWLKKNFTEKTATDLDDMVLDALKTPSKYVIYAITIILSTQQLGVDITNIVAAILILSLARPVAKITQIVMNYIERDLAKRTESKLDDMVLPLINKTVSFLVYLFAVILSLDQLGIEVLPFIAGLGIAGLAIGLAAKDTIANVIAGIFIIIDRPFVVGDRIEVWSAPKQAATWGDVVEIGLRSTKIKTTDNILLVIPNSEISRRDIINYTAISPDIRVRIPIGIAYEADREKAEKIVLDIANNTEGILKEPEPWLVMQAFGASSVDLELRVWIDNARNRKRITSHLSKEIKQEFDRQGIEIPYPRRHIILEKED